MYMYVQLIRHKRFGEWYTFIHRYIVVNSNGMYVCMYVSYAGGGITQAGAPNIHFIHSTHLSVSLFYIVGLGPLGWMYMHVFVWMGWWSKEVFFFFFASNFDHGYFSLSPPVIREREREREWQWIRIGLARVELGFDKFLMYIHSYGGEGDGMT